ncbi:MAG: hypothetical protein PVJ43_07025 [Gemmatimonadales bacterium]|jgi:hypothetical protein
MTLKIVFRSLVLAVIAAVLTASAPRVITFDGSLEDSAVVEAMVESQIAAGDGFVQSHKFGLAVQAYEVAATLDRARGAMPVEAVRRTANALFYQGDYNGASAALTDLADEAVAAGDALTEFWAALDAANMERLAGDADGLERSITRAQLLLDSPAFSETARAEVLRTVTDSDLRVFAPHLTSW